MSWEGDFHVLVEAPPPPSLYIFHIYLYKNLHILQQCLPTKVVRIGTESLAFKFHNLFKLLNSDLMSSKRLLAVTSSSRLTVTVRTLHGHWGITI